MAKPGVSAARFLHLDSYNGWGFADRKGEVEPDHIPGVVVGGEGLVLPRGGLPAGDVPEHVTARVRPRGLAFDRLQRPYAVQDDRRGFCLLAGCARPPPECWSLGAEPPLRLGGVAIDSRERLYIALPEQGEVRVLRLSPASELVRIPMRRPVAVALDASEQLVVLDTGGGEPPPFLEAFSPVVRVARPGDAIAASPSGALAIATRGAAYVELALPGEEFQRIDLERPTLPALAFGRERDASGAELLFVGDRPTARIVKWRIEDGRAQPLQWATAPGAWAALAWSGDVLYALGPQCQVQALEFEAAGFYQRSRSVVIGPLDSGISGTEWHRVTASLAAAPNAEAGVGVEILSADDCEAYDPTIGADDSRWERPRELVVARDGRPAELAFLAARGRYAYLRLTLHGDGRHTPVLRWLRAEFPRDSYLRYLPAVFSEDPVGRSVSARLLSLFESVNVEISSEISTLRRLFEPYALDPSFLNWLAERLDVLLQPDWPEPKARAALADAFWLYRRRGTRAALERLLRDHGGPGIAIVEAHRQRAAFFLGSAALGCGTVLPGSCAPQRLQLDRGVRLGAARLDSSPFVEADPLVDRRGELDIYLPPAVAANAELVARVTRITQLEAPAGAEVRIVKVAPGVRLGSLGRLGVDAALGERSPWRLAGEGEPPPQGTIWTSGMLLARDRGIGGELTLGRGPRLGTDSRL